ncbi:sphingomyelin phosphodiesterase-like [Ornithodoros turicata]|uniref:sphingomyelin phosphodiesterase-like n=1 Tax=Ornithodoros turicata TaxID=34597 RepID=UPI00313A4122
MDEWNKPLPRAFPVVAHGQTVRVLQLSDTHYDPEYTPGSNGDCKDPLCCRSGPPATEAAKAGKWGYPGKCDIPFRTLESMMQHAANTHQIDMILWTGDLPPHDMWKSRKEDNVDNLRNTSALIRKYFPGVPVYPALGNHEAVPSNSFPVKNPLNLTVQWLYDEVASEWERFLPNATTETIKRGAFYAVKAADRLKVISLNTNFCYIYNWWLVYNSTDPEDQLQWLVSQLQESEDAGEKVLIIGHVPPGYSECTKVWSREFHRIVNRYESTITGQFYGHMHSDEFQVYHDIEDTSRPISVAYLGPSVTTYIHQNPGYRVYLLDGKHTNATWTVTDHETYVMNVTDANATDEPKWALEYRAKTAYRLPSLSPTDWSNLISRLSKNDWMFKKFYRYQNKLHPAGVCDKHCKSMKICNMRAYADQVLTDCIKQRTTQ